MDTWWEISKDNLRQRAKQTLAILSAEDKKQQSDHICQQLCEYINGYNNRAAFIPFDYEPNIFPFVEKLRNQNKTVLIPQLDGEQLRLAYYKPESIITQWTYGEWIIENPVWYEWSIDVCLVPWLVFDKQWQRIGHGKWRYDRFLAKNNCYRIGIGFAQITVEKIPHDTHDQKMDAIIT